LMSIMVDTKWKEQRFWYLLPKHHATAKKTFEEFRQLQKELICLIWTLIQWRMTLQHWTPTSTEMPNS
jgi:hypothetical protein